MRIFTNSEKYKPEIKLKHKLVNSPQQADCLILVRGNDPLRYLCGVYAIIDAGSYDEEAEELISKATSKGVPEENILVCADEGGCIDYAEVELLLANIPERSTDTVKTEDIKQGTTKPEAASETEKAGDFWAVSTDNGLNEGLLERQEKTHSILTKPPTPHKGIQEVNSWATVSKAPNKNISLIGFAGGLGRTLIATGLSGTYAGFGEKVALVDLGNPAYSHYYMGLPNLVEEDFGYFARTKWGDIFIPKSRMKHKLLPHLADYKRVIFDLSSYLPPEYREEIFASNKILVVSHDLRALKVTKEKINLYQFENVQVVINKVPVVSQGSYSYVVGGELEIMPALEIPLDEKCSAYIQNYAPVVAENGSSVIAMKIGELASIMNHEMEGDMKYAQGF